MLDKIAKLDSGIIRALLIAGAAFIGGILRLFGVVDEKSFNENAIHVIDLLITFLGAAAGLYIAYARINLPNPPLSDSAVVKSQEMINKQQGGFVSVRLLIALASMMAMVSLVGCAGTMSAYRAAQTRSDTALPDTAYVMTEHYAALVKQAADIKEAGTAPAAVIEKLQQADKKVAPLILGDPDSKPPKPGLKDLSAAFVMFKDAKSEAELQAAVDNGARLLSALIDAVNAARGKL